MNTKTIVCAVAALSGIACLGAQYRLKSSVRVDVLDEKGEVVETKTIPSGTVVTHEEDDKAGESSRLKPSGMSVAEFKSRKPSKGAIFRVSISPSNHPSYYGIFEGKEKSVLQYDIDIREASGDFVTGFYGYCSRNSPIGKKLRLKVTDSSGVLAYVKVRPIKQMGDSDVYIDDIEFL